MKRYTLITLLILLASFNIYSQGDTGAQFLKIGVGAKACAMGEAFVGISDDPSAIYWNPAGIAQINSFEILASQNFWLLDMTSQHGGFALPTNFGVFGLALTYSSSGDIPQYENFEYLGEYSAYDIAGTIAYANTIGEVFSIGFGMKMIQQKIEDESANGYAFDIGMLSRVNALGGLRIGFSIQNLGPSITFIDEGDPLPLIVRGGTSYKVGSFLFSGDINKIRNNNIEFSGGIEILIKEILAIRGGYNTANTYSAGVGINWGKISVGYAFVPYEDIDDTQRISLGIRF